MRTPWSNCTYTWVANKSIGEYAWAGGKEFCVRIGWRKYLYACTPFGYVNLWFRYKKLYTLGIEKYYIDLLYMYIKLYVE